MNPNGVSKDLYLDGYNYDPIYIGPLNDDGYSIVSLKSQHFKNDELFLPGPTI